MKNSCDFKVLSFLCPPTFYLTKGNYYCHIIEYLSVTKQGRMQTPERNLVAHSALDLQVKEQSVLNSRDLIDY